MPLALPAGAALKPSVTCKSATTQPIASGKRRVDPRQVHAGGIGRRWVVDARRRRPVRLPARSSARRSGRTARARPPARSSTPALAKGKCKAPFDTRVKVTGSVTKATGAAAKITKKGEPVTAFVCASHRRAPRRVSRRSSPERRSSCKAVPTEPCVRPRGAQASRGRVPVDAREAAEAGRGRKMAIPPEGEEPR